MLKRRYSRQAPRIDPPFFPESRAGKVFALSVLVLLLACAFGIGYEVASNQRSIPPSWKIIQTTSLLANLALLAVITPVCVAAFARLFSFATARIPEWFFRPSFLLLLLLALVVALGSGTEEDWSLLVASWLIVAGAYTLGSCPVWLTVSMGVFYGIATAATAGIGALFLFGFLVLGLWTYPSQISIKRFLRPSRGVM